MKFDTLYKTTRFVAVVCLLGIVVAAVRVFFSSGWDKLGLIALIAYFFAVSVIASVMAMHFGKKRDEEAGLAGIIGTSIITIVAAIFALFGVLA